MEKNNKMYVLWNKEKKAYLTARPYFGANEVFITNFNTRSEAEEFIKLYITNSLDYVVKILNVEVIND